jgi:hypothetical protein
MNLKNNGAIVIPRKNLPTDPTRSIPFYDPLKECAVAPLPILL